MEGKLSRPAWWHTGEACAPRLNDTSGQSRGHQTTSTTIVVSQRAEDNEQHATLADEREKNSGDEGRRHRHDTSTLQRQRQQRVDQWGVRRLVRYGQVSLLRNQVCPMEDSHHLRAVRTSGCVTFVPQWWRRAGPPPPLSGF